MQRPSIGLVLFCTGIAACVYGWLWVAGLGEPMGPRAYEGLIAFVAIALLSEAMAVDFRIGTGGVRPRSSMAFLPFLGSIALFPPQVSVAVVAGVLAFAQLILLRNHILRAVYNISQAAAAAGIAAAAYYTIKASGIVGAPVLAFVSMAILFFGTNIVLVSVALARMKRASFFEMLSRVTGPGGSNLGYDLLASPIAVVPILLYETSPYLGVVVIVLPLLLLNYSYVTKQEVIEANKDLLRALVKAIETRDPYTSGHSIRVATLARAIAGDMGIRFSKLDQIEMSALLHDIGKIDPIFSFVLSKPHTLTDTERALIQTHAARGAEILSSMSSVQKNVVLTVRHHHERYDGKGYPDGIAGEQIPLAARIIMLCDAVDAMLSDRPYRKALEVQEVYAELRKCAGTQFDPSVVNTVLSHDTISRAVQLVADESRDRQTSLDPNVRMTEPTRSTLHLHMTAKAQ